jgi:acyl-coenzyme A thioesterase PaaI-like protein
MFDNLVFQAIKSQMGSTVPFAKHLGLELTEVGAGTAQAKLPDEKFNNNHIGAQHAGALFTAGETASGAAVAGVLGQRILLLRTVVKDAQIRFLKVARGAILANAVVSGDAKGIANSIDDAGKAEFAVDVSLVDQSGTVVAEMTVNWHVSKREKK